MPHPDLVVEQPDPFADPAYEEEGPRRLRLLACHMITPASEDSMRQWQEESDRKLRQYGHDEGDRRLAEPRRFIKERPTLGELLNESGVRSHSDVIMALTKDPLALRSLARRPRQ